MENFALRSINLLILYGIRRKFLRSGRSRSPINKKGNKTDCSNYKGISLSPNTYKMLSNILLSNITSYVEEIIGDHQLGFQHNRSTSDHIFCIRQIFEKNWNIRSGSADLYRLQRQL